nr:PhoU domain-containing protein [Desulfogranum marinum]
MGKITCEMFGGLPDAVLNKSKEQVNRIIELDDKVDILEAAIFGFLGKIRQRLLTAEESKAHQDLMTATVSLENLADLVETELSGLLLRFIKKERQVSETTRLVFKELYQEVYQSVELAVQSIQNNDQHAALAVINKKENIPQLVERLMARKAEVLGRDQAGDELETARIEISLIDKMTRAYTLTRRFAKITAPPEIVRNV